MPIYAYKCSACGFAKDVLQKMSDAPLTTCLSCGAQTFTKQLTAAGFQLKGSGWYVTDFRDGGSNKGKGADAGAEAGGDDGAAKAEKAEKTEGGGAPAADGAAKPAASADAASAPAKAAPAAAPAATPAPAPAAKSD